VGGFPGRHAALELIPVVFLTAMAASLSGISIYAAPATPTDLRR
jgi:hypothetical protein